MTTAASLLEVLDPDLVERLEGIAKKRNEDLLATVQYVIERSLVGIPRSLLSSVLDYKPQHIPIMVDPHEDKQKKMFRCVVCGTPVFMYYGGVKLITYGIYDERQNMLDGEEQDWFNKIGVPDEVVCSGRLLLRKPDNGTVHARCRTVYYRIGI